MLELLRCEAGHPATPLVAAVSRRRGATLLVATLGCPACGARHDVADGAALLGGDAPPPGLDAPREPAAPEDVLRIAALLDLMTPGGVVALAPAWADCAAPLAALARVPVLVLGSGAAAEGVSPLRGVRAPPVGVGTLRAAALDATCAAPGIAEGWVRSVRAGGRVLGDVAAQVPQGVREMARDGRHWVGEREATATPPVPLGRRGGGTGAPGAQG